jgi:hypothetical protein
MSHKLQLVVGLEAQGAKLSASFYLDDKLKLVGH